MYRALTSSFLILCIVVSIARAESISCPLPSGYDIKPWAEPHSLTGDFDADGIPDKAELVVQRKSGKKGIAVCISKARTPFFLGAGTTMGAGSDTFDWMNQWETYAPSQWENLRPSKISARDALYAGVESGPGGIIYFDGVKFRWIQFGD